MILLSMYHRWEEEEEEEEEEVLKNVMRRASMHIYMYHAFILCKRMLES